MRKLSYYLISFSFLLCYSANALETYKIGVLIDLTGPAAYVGEQYRIGAEIARDELKNEGINVELILGDHTLSTKTAVSEAEKMLIVNKVEALFVNASGPSSAVAPVAAKHKKIMIYAGGAVSPLKNNEYAFKTFTDFRAGCRTLAEKYKLSGIKSLGVLKTEVEPGEMCLEGVQEIFPSVFVQAYKPGEDVSTQVLILKKKKFGAIINPGYEADMLNLLKSASLLDYQGQIGTNIDVLTEKVRSRYPSMLARITTFGMPEISVSLQRKISKKYPQKNFSSLEGAALAYLHIKQLARALSACPRDDLACQLGSLSKSPPDPTIKFEGWNNRTASFNLAIKEWKP